MLSEPPPTADGDLFLDLLPAPEPPAATATLGELYQEQGHHEDAERVFRDVIAEQPDNLLARERLAALAEEPAGGREADEPPPAPAVLMRDLDPAVDRERRIGILRDYLARIRRGREVAAR